MTTTATKHTPGPWTYKRVESNGSLVYALIGHPQTLSLPSPSGVAFAGTYVKSRRSPNRTVARMAEVEAEANARLIASAPELLAERDRLRAENARLREALQAFDRGLRNGSIKWARPRRAYSDPYHPANVLMCAALATKE